MDCLCCIDGGAGPASDTEFLGSICHLKSSDGTPAKFPAEEDRYVMYAIAGCPFAARPWMILGFYGLTESIPVIKLFPASYEDGWFFESTSEGEKGLCEIFPNAQVDKDPVHPDVTHLKELYLKAKPDFQGAISVPLLWDKTTDTAVSNSSLGLSEMIATQMRSIATRHQDVLLFPDRTKRPDIHQEHSDLVKEIHSSITTKVYKINATKDGKEHDVLIDEYYQALDDFQTRIQMNGSAFLMGDSVRFADFVLFISLVRLDLAYQWKFGLGRKNIRDNYPILADYVTRIMKLPGISETILPRDIMALYFMSPKWNTNVLPMVPMSWATHFQLGS